MPTYTIKRGDTFKPLCRVLDDSDVAEPINGWTIASHVRTAPGRLVATLTAVDRDDNAGEYYLESDTDTADWPVASLIWDVQYTDGTGAIRSTETITLVVVEDITHS